MAEWPLVSVVVPVRNEIGTIARCLAALATQDYPGPLEIVVADGDSDDGTPDAVRRFAATARVPVRLVANPKRHAGPGANAAIAVARGTIVARVDGHAEAPPDFLRRCVAALAGRSDVECASGALDTVGRTATGRAIAAAMSSAVGVGTARFRTGAASPCLVDTVAFPVYRRATLERIGVFDEELVRNQDDELNLRLTRAGGRILLLPDVRLVYYCRDRLGALWRQYREYGFWKVRVIQKHGAPASWRHLVPATLVAGLAGGPLVALVVPALRPVVGAGVAGYAAAIGAAAAGLARRRHAWRLAPRIAAALVTLHVAYGVGFWEGVVRFVLRPRVRGAGSGPRDPAVPRAARVTAGVGSPPSADRASPA
jgi:succinoglycan biosynthesis protein ExoA